MLNQNTPANGKTFSDGIELFVQLTSPFTTKPRRFICFEKDGTIGRYRPENSSGMHEKTEVVIDFKGEKPVIVTPIGVDLV